MSVTIGDITVVNPQYSGGDRRERDIVVGSWRFLDGARGRHYITGQWRWSLVWRVQGDDYDGDAGVKTALLAVEAGTFAFTDWDGDGGTCELDGNWTDDVLSSELHEIRATFAEVTA
ncbi:MAG: hypothetical protein ABFD96_09820 [Armatimonadia bacterium]